MAEWTEAQIAVLNNHFKEKGIQCAKNIHIARTEHIPRINSMSYPIPQDVFDDIDLNNRIRLRQLDIIVDGLGELITTIEEVKTQFTTLKTVVEDTSRAMFHNKYMKFGLAGLARDVAEQQLANDPDYYGKSLGIVEKSVVDAEPRFMVREGGGCRKTKRQLQRRRRQRRKA